MIKLFLTPLAILGLLLLSSCSQDTPYTDKPLKVIYADGIQQLKNESYKKAADEFEQVEQQYPYSPWAPKAQLLSAYAAYKDKNYIRAIGTLDQFLQIHPYHALSPYGLYLRALCYFDQIQSVQRDMENTQHALSALEEVTARFPDSIYGKAAKPKAFYAFEQMAAQHMYIGRYYQKENLFVAAFPRFQKVIQGYGKTRYYPEALFRLMECALTLGLDEEALAALEKMNKVCPESPWTKDAKNLHHTHIKPPLKKGQKNGQLQKNLKNTSGAKKD